MVRVMIAGKFDPMHDGHIDHIMKASALGDYLCVVTHSDEVLDKIKPQGHQVPLWARLAMIKGIMLLFNIKGEVVISVDDDGTVEETLRCIRPDIFAKGGDRTVSNMPKGELKVCKELNITIVYGTGALLNSSSKITKCGVETFLTEGLQWKMDKP